MFLSTKSEKIIISNNNCSAFLCFGKIYVMNYPVFLKCSKVFVFCFLFFVICHVLFFIPLIGKVRYFRCY